MSQQIQEQLTQLHKNIEQYQGSLTQNKSELLFLMKDGFEKLSAIDFPHRKQEQWKYTNIKNSFFNNTKLEKLSGKMGDIVSKDVPPQTPHFVFINGKLSTLLSSKTEKVKFIHLDPSNDVHYIEKGSINFKINSDDFCDALNLATLREGLQIQIDEQSSIDAPIIISHIFTSDCKHNVVSPRISITTNPRSKATFIERFQYKGLQDSDFTLNNVTELTLNHSSHIEYIQLQKTTTPVVHFNTVKSDLYKDATLNLVNLTYGGKLSRNNFYANINEQGACANMSGLYSLRNDQHSDQYININHLAPHSQSHQLFKGILDDQSHGIFTGKVHVSKNCELVDSTQVNNNLILSEHAHIDTRPQLEIYTDDVKCSHGATIGQLNDEEVFYLETRGIKPEIAKEMVSKGFGEDVLFRVQNKEIRKLVKSWL